MAFLLGTSAPVSIQRLAVPAICLLIAFLGYGSQYLFAHSPDLAPGPLTSGQKHAFNTLLICLWWTYYQACSIDPGRYIFPPKKSDDDSDAVITEGSSSSSKRRKRWCRKCNKPKPPRAHHCKTCARCIPKMDHHCPWTANCVSLQTFPHFLRFLVYTNASLWTLLYFLSLRFYALWENRALPAYLGPSFGELVWLTLFTFVAGCTSLALGILLITTVKGWVFNETMIEGWEIERHEAVLERHDAGEGWWREGEGAPGGDANAPHLMIETVEFPYDIGFFVNMAQAMGTSNVLLWFLPFVPGPEIASNRDGKGRGTGWEYEENGLNDREDMWPPTDPDKVRHEKMWQARKDQMTAEQENYEAGRWASPEEQREVFRRRQEQDLRRWESTKRRILGELEEIEDYDFVDEVYDKCPQGAPGRSIIDNRGKPMWVNEDGEDLADYGVDEEAEFDEPQNGSDSDEEDSSEDVPLGELIRRRKVMKNDGSDE